MSVPFPMLLYIVSIRVTDTSLPSYFMYSGAVLSLSSKLPNSFVSSAWWVPVPPLSPSIPVQHKGVLILSFLKSPVMLFLLQLLGFPLDYTLPGVSLFNFLTALHSQVMTQLLLQSWHPNEGSRTKFFISCIQLHVFLLYHFPFIHTHWSSHNLPAHFCFKSVQGPGLFNLLRIQVSMPCHNWSDVRSYKIQTL